MAWRCSGTTQLELVQNLVEAGILSKQKVIEALKMVDRKNFCPQDPYVDSPQNIGFNATISAPHIHAEAMEHLYNHVNRDNSKVLDVGCGSGYLTAVMSRLNPSGKIYGIDCIPQLVELATKNIKKNDNDLLESKRIQLAVADGWSGLKSAGPFDAIHVGAAANKIPHTLVEQLKINGRMLIPVGEEYGVQELMLVDKIKEGTTSDCLKLQRLMLVCYVPLVKNTS